MVFFYIRRFRDFRQDVLDIKYELLLYRELVRLQQEMKANYKEINALKTDIAKGWSRKIFS